MNRKIFFLIAGIIIGIFGILALENTSPILSSKTSMGSSQNSDFLDAHFIEQMIPHHEDAITMAELAETKAQRLEIKQLAKNIIFSQSREIDQMKTWYKDWFGKDVPDGDRVMNQHGMMVTNSMHMGMMGTDADLEKLSGAADFDTEFIREMIPHHQMAVMMANMLRNGTNRPEMKRLAEDIITAQTEEIDQMRIWLKDWSEQYDAR